MIWEHLGAEPRRPGQEDCVPLIPVPQTGFPLLNYYRNLQNKAVCELATSIAVIPLVAVQVHCLLDASWTTSLRVAASGGTRLCVL